MKIGGILLAAGASRRMGRPKQLLPFKGTTLIQYMCEELLKVDFEQFIVVLGANEALIRPKIESLPVHIVVNKAWDRGMGGSITKGLSFSLRQATNLDAYIIVLCDQPFLTADYLNLLCQNHQTYKKGIISSEYANTIGVPAFFHKKYEEDLLALNGQRGAKKLFKKYKHDLLSIPFPEGEIDLDTPDDYERFGK